MSKASTFEMSRKTFIGGTVAVAAPYVLGAAGTEPKKGKLGKYVGTLVAGRYDAHIHVHPGEPDPDRLVKSFAEAGLVGGVVFSRSPYQRFFPKAKPQTPEEAVDNVIAWCSGSPSIYPFFFIDPAAPDACEQVDMAVEKGIYGFKVIRGDGPPVDDQTIKAYRRMAFHDKPVTFHSGILWDGRDSSDYFRPAKWEGLLGVPHLRFALAHISWPWCDECIAVYGKMLNAIKHHGNEVPEMFIDTTPGTPKIYRRDALAKVYTVGYDVLDHVTFGTDCNVNRYNVKWSTDWQRTDSAILSELGGSPETAKSYGSGALRRFLFGGGGTRTVPVTDGVIKSGT